jgi:predicted nicotinamide N-methyase
LLLLKLARKRDIVTMFDGIFGAREGDTSDDEEQPVSTCNNSPRSIQLLTAVWHFLHLGPNHQKRDVTTEAASTEPLIFYFGDIRAELPADGTNMATQVWSSSLVAAALVSGCLVLEPDEQNGQAQPASSALAGKQVLEVGCGRGLAGIVAGQCGADRVVFTDCDDRALIDLQAMNLNKSLKESKYFERHHLWEQDEAYERERENAPRVKHCSDAHRDERILMMENEAQFDLVIAADCLYWTQQEESLASVLRQRVRKPDGRAVICMQPRHENSFMFARFRENLCKSGFEIFHQDELEWTTLMAGVTIKNGYEPGVVPNQKPGQKSNLYQIVVATWPK